MAGGKHPPRACAGRPDGSRRFHLQILVFFRGKESSVADPPPGPRIGVLGMDEPSTDGPRGCRLWDVGYESTLRAAGAEPFMLGASTPRRGYKEWLSLVDGIVWTSTAETNGQATTDDIAFCQWCRKNRVPLLA